MRKKTFVLIFLFTLIIFNYISCSKNNEEKISNEIQQLKNKITILEKENKELMNKKDKAIENASKSESSKSLLIGLILAVGIIMFFLGIGIGSKTSSDYKAQNKEEKENEENKKNKKK